MGRFAGEGGVDIDCASLSTDIRFMANAELAYDDVKQLVLESAGSLKDKVFVRDADVRETVTSEDEPALLIRLAVARPENRKDWVVTRLRLSQAIRDHLLEKGDDRYPFLVIFSPEEWAARDNA